jgi:phage host-nuclease inhibitor protein Gam
MSAMDNTQDNTAPVTREAVLQQLNEDLAKHTKRRNEINTLNAKFNDQQVAHNEQVEPLLAANSALEKKIFAQMKQHRSLLLEGDAKSVKLLNGTIGWRMGTKPTLIVGSKERLLQTLKKLRLLRRFTKPAEPIIKTDDLKEAIKQDPRLQSKLAGIASVETKETAFFDPDKTLIVGQIKNRRVSDD